MSTNYITPRKTGYYRCGGRYRLGVQACPQSKVLRAEDTESLVWSFVSGILKDSARLERGLNEMLEQEKGLASRRPAEEEKIWLEKLSELETQEERLLDLYLDNKLAMDRYDFRIAEIKRSRRTVKDELVRIRDGAAHIKRPERDAETACSLRIRFVMPRLYFLVVAAFRAGERPDLTGAVGGYDSGLVEVVDVAAFLALLAEGHDRTALVDDLASGHLYSHVASRTSPVRTPSILLDAEYRKLESYFGRTEYDFRWMPGGVTP